MNHLLYFWQQGEKRKEAKKRNTRFITFYSILCLNLFFPILFF